MITYIKLTFLFCLFSTIGYSQKDTTTHKSYSDIFERITKATKEFKPDTTPAPDDKMTRKIIQLRSLKGGFNINEAIEFKIEEDRQKKEVSNAELDKLSAFFKSGNGKKWLDNAVIWIYRSQFTYSELKQLVKFYKKSTGQKMAATFPIIMLQSLTAAEIIKDFYAKQQSSKGK